MSSKFITTDRDQAYLFPPTIKEWLPENHLARFVVDIVSQLDLSPLVQSYKGVGSKAYHPEIMLSLLFYGYATGVYSSRKIERATYDSVAFRFIAADTHPDHDTIATFRKKFLNQLRFLFVQILVLCKEMGIMQLGKVSIDGTKIKANASKHRALSYGHACKLEKQLKSEVDELLRLAEEADNSEIPDGMDVPEELSRRQDRLRAITDAKRKIEERAEKKYIIEKADYDKKMKDRKEKEDETGKKPKGPTPKPPESGPQKKDQVNLTDEESRIMPCSGKTFKQAYNAQACVDLDTMIVVETHITQSPNDKQEIDPALSILKNLPPELGSIDTILADAGYFSEHNVLSCKESEIEPLIATGRATHNQSLYDRFIEPDPLTENGDAVIAMRNRLKSKAGRDIYAKRKCTVEPVFGVIKNVMGFRQFLMRGHESVSAEWLLVSIGWNLKRMFALLA